jgi:hypothetical protein
MATKRNTQTQYPNIILYRNRKKSPQIHMETKNTLNIKSNPEQKEQPHQISNYTQSQSNKNSMVQAQK